MKRKFEYSLFNVVLLFGVALVLLFLGYFMVSMSNKTEDNYRKKKRIYEKTTGECVDNDKVVTTTRSRKRTRTETDYYAIYEYVVNNQTYRHRSTVSTNFKTSIGSTVKVYYNPKNPGNSFTEKEVNSNRRARTTGEVFFIIGIAVAIGNVIWIIYNKKNGKACR